MSARVLSLELIAVLATLLVSSCAPSAAAPPADLPTESPHSPPAAPTPTTPPTPQPTPAPAEEIGPAFARDAAVAYLAAHYGDLAPAADLEWTEEDITREDLLGSSTFRYTAGDWTITVSYPIVAPDQTIYTVAAANELTGFSWEGRILPSGDLAEPAPERPSAELRPVAFGGVSFSYDGSLAQHVRGESVPESDVSELVPDASIPEHLEFAFDGYVLPRTFHEPRIYVYPAAELEAGWERSAEIVATLRQTLTDRPSEPGVIVTLPPMNACQLIRARVGYVDFQNGSGVRFLTLLGQAYRPANNFELFYTFQGLTDDGRTYISVILPVSHPSLPDDETQIPGGDADVFAQQYESYAAEIEAQLNAYDPGSFTPSLWQLDALIQTLAIEQDCCTVQ